MPQEEQTQDVVWTPGLQIAMAVATLAAIPLDPEFKNAAIEAAKLCESLGHKVEEAQPPIEDAWMRVRVLDRVASLARARVLDNRQNRSAGR